MNLISKSITFPTKVSEVPSLAEIFNLIPEINSNKNLKCLFSILFAQVSSHNGNVLLEKQLLEDALKFLFETFGEYSIVSLPLTLALSKANRELGFIDDCYKYLNKAFKVAYFNKGFNSLEVLEVLNHFALFSKYINETNEEGIYAEIIGKLIKSNLMRLEKKSKNFKEKQQFMNGNNNKENKQSNDDNSAAKIKKDRSNKNNNAFVNFKNLPYEDKLEILIQIGYLLKYVDHLSTFGKIGKNTQNIIEQFNYCNELLENMGILNVDKRTFSFDLILNDFIDKNTAVHTNSSNELGLRLEENFIYFYLNPDLKNFIRDKKAPKNKSEENNNNNNIENNKFEAESNNNNTSNSN